MDQSVTHQFQAALAHLLDREGRGAQSRLAGEQSLDRGYVNAIVKGRKSGSDEVKTRIAGHFNMTYDEMLALGRGILGGGQTEISVEKPEKRPHTLAVDAKASGHKDVTDPASLQTGRSSQSGLSKKIMKVVEILESDTRYRNVLEELIDVFHVLVNNKSDRLVLGNRMAEMESRISSLEKRLALEIDRA